MNSGSVLRRAALALSTGLLLFAAFPPLDVGAVGLVALAPLAALCADLRNTLGQPGERARTAFGWGVLAGLAFFLPLLEWIGLFGTPAWFLLSLLQASFVGVFVLLWSRWRGPGVIVVGVALWSGLEALRSAVPLGGFPWGLLGYSQHSGGVLLGSARTVGVLGVGAMAAAVGFCVWAAGSALWQAWRRGGPQELGSEGVNAARTPAVALLVVLVAAVLLGVDPPAASDASIDIAAVQGNDLQDTAGVGNRRVREVAQRVASLSATLADAETLPDVIVWPENSLDEDVTADPALRRIVAPSLRATASVPVLAGMLADGPRPGTFLNTVTVLKPGPTLGEQYVKRKVVPFGEYVPGRRFLQWISALDQIPNDALPGDDVGIFTIAGAKIGTLICFENIFPGLSRDAVDAGADVLVVSTNNASYDHSAASRQHLAFSQLRAVETGRWIMHAGISGISAVVDPEGRVSQQTEVFEQAIVRAELPLVAGRTPAQSVAGPLERLSLWVLAGLVLVLLWQALQRRRSADGESADVSNATPVTEAEDA